MLTLEENSWNFKAISIDSALNLFPIEIDTKTGRIKRQSTKMRIWLWRLVFSLVISHWFYMLWRLVQSTILEPEKYFRWDHFMIHESFTVAYALVYCNGFCIFVRNPEECVLVFNQLFIQRTDPVQKMMDQEKQEEQRELERDGAKRAPFSAQEQDLDLDLSSDPPEKSRDEGKSETESGFQVRPLLTWPLQYSLDEILARTISLITETTAFMVLVIYAVAPNRPQLLYSSLPPEYQNPYSFLGLLTVEATVLALVFGLWAFSTSCQLFFFRKCQQELKGLDLTLRNLQEKFQSRAIKDGQIGKEIWILREISKELRELVLFNRCFPPCIFAIKLNCFNVAISSYFFTIRHGQDFPFLAPFTGYAALLQTLVYGVLYQNAFSIPRKFKG